MKLSTLITLPLAALALAGCAALPALDSRVSQALEPDSVSAVVTHVGHLTTIVSNPIERAAGMTDLDPTYDTLGLEASWQRGPLWLSIGDGYAFSDRDALAGPREVFNARVGLVLWRGDR